jgi:hypothetical protein
LEKVEWSGTLLSSPDGWIAATELSWTRSRPIEP